MPFKKPLEYGESQVRFELSDQDGFYLCYCRYLDILLKLIERIYSEYVLPGKDPPVNMFFGDPDYYRFLHHTLRIARSATLVADVPSESPIMLLPESSPQAAFVNVG
jgi:hypothetical protein